MTIADSMGDLFQVLLEQWGILYEELLTPRILPIAAVPLEVGTQTFVRGSCQRRTTYNDGPGHEPSQLIRGGVWWD